MQFDADRRAVFLKTLTETLNVSGSARAAGVCKRTVYNAREADPEFAQAWDAALDEGLDNAEESVNRRAFIGVLKPVYQQGQMVGKIREYSDGLAQFMLKAHRPEKYREKTALELTGKDGAPLQVDDGTAAAKLAAILEELRHRKNADECDDII